ncbi:MAG: hypothetical protein DRQ61_12655 [Gammaproteobacteria bacterium]|nr:MAG: hypothetical protein DRQ61_12655 [Gammaproteobacteria bacterium]
MIEILKENCSLYTLFVCLILLRHFFPKRMKMGNLSKKEIEAAELSINMRPRKALNYLSSLEFLTGQRVSVMLGI